MSRILRFQAYSIHIDPTFWSTLYEIKLNVWKLDDSDQQCKAIIENNSVYLSRSSLENNSIERNEFEGITKNGSYKPANRTGMLKVFNTRSDLIEYHKENKQLLLKRDDLLFVLLVHADLKQYSFDYYFALPTIYPSSPFYACIEKNNTRGDDVLINSTLVRENDCFVLPWTVRNEIFNNYQQGRRRFRITPKTVGKNDSSLLNIKCHERHSIRYTGWSSATMSTVNLSQTMDPHVIAEQNAELNLKLMMWKHEPNLPLDKLRQVRCLLLGSGTVGCGVARNLISWGVRNITFVDCANVSHSNPVRQNLYSTHDIGKEKAPSAAETLSSILPSVTASGHTLNIPMPGHNHSSTEADYNELDKLVSACDVIFLSTDSREGRWLPILLAKKHRKNVVNIALGYETLVIQWISDNNGCYFCTDPVGPRDTMSSRTIDEKCTITRPGISSIASSVAVELFVDIIKGTVHHDQIRFSLHDMKFSCQKSFKNDQCSCCSIEMISEILDKGYRFVEEVKCYPNILDDLSGYNDDACSDIMSIDLDVIVDIETE